MENKANDSPVKGKSIKMYIPLILIIILVLGGSWYWYKEYSKYISTDDAHIDADIVSISSKIMGRITTLYADEGDSVKKDMLIAVLDSSELVSQKKQAIAMKNQATASKAQSEAKYRFDEENIKVLEVNLGKAKEDFERAKNQLAGEVITKENYSHFQKAYESAMAQLEAAKSQLSVSKAQITSAQASIESSQAQIGVIETQLNNTKIYAPVDGIIAKRWLLPGDIAQQGQSIMTVINNNKLWVIVYIEETNLSSIHINQDAIFSVDAFSGVNFKGKVFSIGSNTAAQFSLIPPNNASGNFTKVTQRIPLKISIDTTEDGNKTDKYNFLSGMSVVVKIVRN